MRWFVKLKQRLYPQMQSDPALLFLLVMMSLLFIFWLIVLMPMTQHWYWLRAEQQRLHLAVEEQTLIKRDIENTAALSADSKLLLELNKRQRDISAIEVALGYKVEKVISVEALTAFVEKTLKTQKGITALSYESLPKQLIAGSFPYQYFAQPVRFRIKGKYADVLSFYQKLELSDEKYYWQKIAFEMHDKKTALSEFELYTISRKSVI